MSIPIRVVTEEAALEQEVRRHISVTTWGGLLRMAEQVYNWGRRSSIWPLQFGLACCAIEMIATAASRFDIARFGAELFRASPRQADLMIVSGTVTKKMVPMIVRLYNQMPEPKYVISMGACATAGGPFKEGYNVVSGIDKFLPVDVYIPGCPPTPQALLHGLMTLQKIIDGQEISKVRWYQKNSQTLENEIPVPLLGPDLIDQRRIPEIQKTLREAGGQSLAGTVPALPATIPSFQATPTEGRRELIARLRQQFGQDAVEPQGDALLLAPAVALTVARYLKEQPDLGYDYLANLTSADYQDCFEVVSHVVSTARSEKPLTLKVRTPKDNPRVPSLTPVWPGANFQERECYDMMGIHFEGHPNLRRILMWDGFEGWPLRKNYLEPYYEEPGKMFSSRWKEGHHRRAEGRVFWRDNVKYPASWDASQKTFDDEAAPPVDNEGVSLQQNGDFLVVNLGPQHPSTHGVFRMKVAVQGERIVGLEPIMGYMHRNHEKIGERNTYIMNFPYTDRLDYLTSMGNNFGYAIAVEKLTGVPVPERADYIRIIMAEYTRILSHFWATGFLLNDLGAFFTPALYAIEERELILDLFEMVSGSRMMCNYFRFGGVAADLTEEFMTLSKGLIEERLPRSIDQIDRFLSRNEILTSRCKGVGALTREQAIAMSASGPVLRASGVSYDVRRAQPYSLYERFPFEIPTRTTGDVYARYQIRIDEMRESLRILRQAFKELPAGEIQGGKKAWNVRVPAGESYGRVENPKGELGFYIVGDGTDHPYRYHVRSPSFINLTALETMCRGHLVADVVAILGSIDIVLGEVDR
ncbi:MAG: NADH-quinone oxidoreductase subunit D [Candidatus Omnitrophica bacterium]|nr:NADH-quinone oxidoreductase subunit D [Candidatus Omnitrophota bacterium]